MSTGGCGISLDRDSVSKDMQSVDMQSQYRAMHYQTNQSIFISYVSP